MYARYIVLIDRELGESDGRQPVTEDNLYPNDGTYIGAAGQLQKELQYAWDCSGVAGTFKVAGRAVISDEVSNDLIADDPYIPIVPDESEIGHRAIRQADPVIPQYGIMIDEVKPGYSSFVGPFFSREAAIEHQTKNFSRRNSQIIELFPPEDF